jgi:hypothetical protein
MLEIDAVPDRQECAEESDLLEYAASENDDSEAGGAHRVGWKRRIFRFSGVAVVTVVG